MDLILIELMLCDAQKNPTIDSTMKPYKKNLLLLKSVSYFNFY